MTEEARHHGILTHIEREKILYYKELGHSHQEIARTMNRSHTCISNAIRDFFHGPRRKVFDSNPEMERKRLSSEDILTETLADRFLMCRELSARIQTEFNITRWKSQAADYQNKFDITDSDYRPLHAEPETANMGDRRPEWSLNHWSE
jgi:IS30 family transposase